MMHRRPNVLLLTVDALRTDHTSLHGYGRPTTPVMEKLAADAFVCDQTVSLGPFTQSACIQLFTSTPPLAYGGYDRGAEGRPDTVFKRFRDEGYRTVGLSTLHWVNRFFGYGPGFEEEHQLFIPNTLIGAAVATMRSSLVLYRQEIIGKEEMLAVVRPTVSRLLDDTEEYCALRIMNAREQRISYPDSLLVNERYDFDRVRRVIARHRAEFDRDPSVYIDRHLGGVPRPHGWLAKDWRFCRPWHKLLNEAISRMINRLIGLSDPALASARAARYRQYVDAGALADKTIELMRASHDRPFFLWAHFMDTHIPFVSGRGPHWYRETPKYLAELGYPPHHDVAQNFREERPKDRQAQADLLPLYDAAIRWTDEQIGRIVAALDDTGIAEDTIVAICGDHGEEIGDHGDVGHYFLFYEHNIRVPMLFRRKGMTGRRIGSLTTSMDLAPTLADMCGIPPVLAWQGAAVYSEAAASRQTTVAETFYGGNCVFESRPVYLGVRSDRYKLLWKERRDPGDRFSAEGSELYDYRNDPAERTNLYRPDHPALPQLIQAAAERFAGIKEISDERVVNAFGAAGIDAVRRVRSRVATP